MSQSTKLATWAIILFMLSGGFLAGSWPADEAHPIGAGFAFGIICYLTAIVFSFWSIYVEYKKYGRK